MDRIFRFYVSKLVTDLVAIVTSQVGILEK